MLKLFKNIYFSIRYLSLIWGNVKIHKSAKVRFSIIRGNVILDANSSIFRGDLFGNINLGSYSYITGPNTFLHSLDKNIQISEHSSIAPGVKIITSGHSLETESTSFRHGGKRYEKDISIGNHCWIGAGSILTSGCVIEDFNIIAAGGVATEKVYESGFIWGGVPLKKIKSYK